MCIKTTEQLLRNQVTSLPFLRIRIWTVNPTAGRNARADMIPRRYKLILLTVGSARAREGRPLQWLLPPSTSPSRWTPRLLVSFAKFSGLVIDLGVLCGRRFALCWRLVLKVAFFFGWGRGMSCSMYECIHAFTYVHTHAYIYCYIVMRISICMCV